jgi:hypothetical protein
MILSVYRQDIIYFIISSVNQNMNEKSDKKIRDSVIDLPMDRRIGQ